MARFTLYMDHDFEFAARNEEAAIRTAKQFLDLLAAAEEGMAATVVHDEVEVRRATRGKVLLTRTCEA